MAGLTKLCSSWLLLVAVVSCVQVATSDPTPLVMWHGMGDSCCLPFSLGRIQKLIESKVPGIYVHSIEIGNDVVEDTLSGFFVPCNKQIEMVCKMVQNDSKLANGFNSMGFSQGGQFLRALVQRCPGIKMFNLLSVGGQHQGVFGFPHCMGANESLCEEMRRLLNIGAYVDLVQDILVQAEYWQDPLNEAEYRKKSIFLADINQENTFNKAYKDRLSSLANLVLVKFLKDTMVQPKESEWFGFYKEGQDKETFTLQESTLYNESDFLGLKALDSEKRIHFLGAPFDHLKFTEEWFLDNLLQFINVTLDEAHKPITMKL